MNDSDGWIPLENMSPSARMSFEQLHPKLLKKAESDLEKWFFLTCRLVDLGESIKLYILMDEAVSQVSQEQNTKPISNVKGKYRSLIDSSLKISDVAKKYGLKVEGNKAVCPFHDDKDPSLSLSDQKNVFYCFGCQTKGDIVEFIRRLEE